MNNYVYSSYNMLPKFGKIENPIFINSNANFYRKLHSINKYETYFEYNCSENIKQTIKNYILNNTELHNSMRFANIKSIGYILYEDFAIHRVIDDKDWLCLAHVCFPNGWFPDKQIGKSYEELHSHIPGMNVKNSKKILNACINSGPFERYVWGIVYEFKMNGHPSIPIKKFDINNPEFYIRVENQFIIGFPELNCFLFVLRQNLLLEHEIDKAVLYNTLCGMSKEEKVFKGITEEFINYVGSSI